MRDLTTGAQNLLSLAHRHRGLVLPCMAAGMVLVLLVPLPPALLDFLLVGNVALAAVILLTTIHVRRPLDLSIFPTLLLMGTLGRLVLNVATTRLILTAGTGRSVDEAQAAAGQVVWAFGSFVTNESLVAGAIVFGIIIVIQFIVVTKGAARVSEVAARFVLDAMPGKQLAIDQDLSAKLIDETTARARRLEVAHEADFYGAMDGAGKFLRGDAVAAVLITFINILGGLYVGMVQCGWGLSETLGLFTRLTIGEGLVMQVPAFLLAVASALLVTRSSARVNLGEEFIGQLTARPAVLVTAGAFLGLLALTPLPTLPLLVCGGALTGLAWLLSRRGGQTPSTEPAFAKPAATATMPDVADLVNVDPLRIEIGYALIKLTDQNPRTPSIGFGQNVRAGAGNNELLDRVASVRRQVAQELGVLVPAVRICDNLRLDAHAYVIKLRGAKIAQGHLHPKLLLAVSDGRTAGRVTGIETSEPICGAPAVWISPDERDRAERLGYMVNTPTSVLGTHLGEVIRSHAADLLTRQQAQALLDALATRCKPMVDEAISRFGVGTIQKTMQLLLHERVSVRDLEAIVEAVCDWSGTGSDAAALSEHVRSRIGRTLCQQYADDKGRLWCVRLDEQLEDELSESAQPVGEQNALLLDGEQSQRLLQAVAPGLDDLRRQGRQGVVLCSPLLRRAVKQAVTGGRMDAAVLSYDEVDAVSVQTLSYVGATDDAQDL